MLYHRQWDGKEELTCFCGCKGKKKPHRKGEPYFNGKDTIENKALFCGSCGRMLVDHHGEVV